MDKFKIIYGLFLIVPEIEAIRTERFYEYEKQKIQVVPSAKAANFTMNRKAIRDLAAKELGLKTDKQLVFLGETEIENQSFSYPGLCSRYRIFNYQINLDKQDLEFIRFSEYQQQKITFFTLD